MGGERDRRGDHDRRQTKSAEAETGQESGSPGKRTLTEQLTARVFRRASGARVSPFARRLLLAAAARSGRALPQALRERLERALGANLDAVRVHTDGDAAEAAAAVGARAYTIGQDVYFARDAFDPASEGGQHLIAHEVAHTVQQRAASVPSTGELPISSPGDASEVEADAAADAFVFGRTELEPPPPGIVASGTNARAELPPLGLIASGTDAFTIALQPDPAATAQPAAPPGLRELLSRLFESENFRPAASTTAMFDARYEPAAGLLTIVSRIAFAFDDPNASRAASTVGQVQKWQGQFSLEARAAGWEELPPVRVAIEIQETAPERAHFIVRAGRLPEEEAAAEKRKVVDDIKAAAVDRRAVSAGDMLRSWHYTTFVEVLVAMTGIAEWAMTHTQSVAGPVTL